MIKRFGGLLRKVSSRMSSSSACAVHLTSAPPSGDGKWPVRGYEVPKDAHASEASPVTAGGTLETLSFDNRTLRELPVDEEKTNYVRTVRNACFSRVSPTPVDNPCVVSLSLPALSLLGVRREEVEARLAKGDFAAFFSGNQVLPGADPAAHCYCGHQFGHFSGQLGDGATMYLAEALHGGLRWELQFKGAGKTPYSRTADGRKVLRSSLREFLCSELMASLGVPSTRAGTCVTSDTKVVRDIFYSGQPVNERATVITRIAPTFLRFGSFEIAKPRDPITGRTGPSVGRTDIVRDLARYTLLHFYGDLVNEEFGSSSSSSASSASSTPGDVDKATEDAFDGLADDDEKKTALYLRMFGEICKGSARLVAHWQALGWCHGVMNTDNCAILPWPRPVSPGHPSSSSPASTASAFIFGGSAASPAAGNVTLDQGDQAIYATGTIDYGPFGWMERFNPSFICNASDNDGRYSYEAQPHVMRWNCLKLGEQLSFLFSKEMQQSDASAGAASSATSAPAVPRWKRLIPSFYDRHYSATYRALMARKLGLGWTMTTDAETEGEKTEGKKAMEEEKSESADNSEDAWEDRVDALVGELLGVMHASGGDYTNCFRGLMQVPPPPPSSSSSSSSSDEGKEETALLKQVFAAHIRPQLSTVEELSKSFEPRIPPAQLGMLMMMAEKDPRFADHLDGLQEEMKRHEEYRKLKSKTEEAKAKEDEELWLQWLKRYRAELQKEVDRAAASSSSSSSFSFERFKEERLGVMSRSNPVFVLRNWVAQEAIQAAEGGDFSVVADVLKRMHDPFALSLDRSVLSSGTEVDDASVTSASAEGGAGAGSRMTKVGKSGLSETSDAVAKASEETAAAACGSAGGQPSQPSPGGFLGQLPVLSSDQFACKAPSWASNLRVT